MPAPAAPVLLPGLKQSSCCQRLTPTVHLKHCVRTTAELKLPVNSHTDLWHPLPDLQEIHRLTKVTQQISNCSIWDYFPSARHQQLPTAAANQHLKFKSQAVTFLVLLTLFMELQTWPVKRWENQQLYKELFQLVIELLTFSPSLLFIFLTRIPYKPSNSLILFHLQSVRFYHAALRYSELAFAFLLPSPLIHCILIQAFCCKFTWLQRPRISYLG